VEKRGLCSNLEALGAQCCRRRGLLFDTVLGEKGATESTPESYVLLLINPINARRGGVRAESLKTRAMSRGYISEENHGAGRGVVMIISVTTREGILDPPPPVPPLLTCSQVALL
jgi:hypothetical protein